MTTDPMPYIVDWNFTNLLLSSSVFVTKSRTALITSFTHCMLRNSSGGVGMAN